MREEQTWPLWDRVIGRKIDHSTDSLEEVELLGSLRDSIDTKVSLKREAIILQGNFTVGELGRRNSCQADVKCVKHLQVWLFDALYPLMRHALDISE